MTKKQYSEWTGGCRRVLNCLPGGIGLLKLPTYLCALLYVGAVCFLAVQRAPRLLRVILVPAICFATVTILRPVIGRERPYDFFGLPPVGKWEPGKGLSMPSRHTASAVAIAFAVVYAFPSVPAAIGMVLLSLLIAALRVISGHHYPSDVLAAIGLSLCISLLGYLL